MPKRIARPDPESSLDLWASLDRPSFEADEAELIAHVDRRLGRSRPRASSPTEPTWLVEACEAAWPRLLREAEAGLLRA